MLNTLTLKNYRQHEDRTFDFSDDLNVIKGANENGKSTILEALLYLWLGRQGVLAEPLEDVVTYGRDVKELLVRGNFTFEGVEYEMYRSAKGAEIVYGDKRVSGQSATRQFMETLLGAKADVVKKLMIAEQNAVRGILTDDNGAGQLIEDLADLGLIDTYIEKIQAQLPCGPTKGQEASVATLAESIPAIPAPPSTEALQLAGVNVEASAQELEAAKTTYSELASRAAEAEKVIADAAAHSARREAMQKRIAELEAVKAPDPCQYTEADIAHAEKLEADATWAAKVEAERSKVFGTASDTWSGNEESAVKGLAELRATAKTLRENVADLRAKIVGVKATAINEGVCAFCKEDISKRPEVLQINSEVSSKVSAYEAQVAKLNSSIIAVESDIATVESILAIHRENTRKANPEFWATNSDTLPCVYHWVGPADVSSQTVSVSSSAMRKALAAYRQAFDRYESAQFELKAAEVPAELDKESLLDARAILMEADAARQAVVEAERNKVSADHAYQLAKLNYDKEVEARESAIARQKQARDAYEAAKKTLESMLYNNELIKDLREARSEIRRRLWQSVTATISAYFTRIRRKETVIAQSPDGFTQNGRSVKGLSGSAKDMLGLSLRASLMKTFIPGATMMFTDEPFSGCDADRETAGIGVLASLGFEQTVLVTHSDLADAVAKNLISV